MPIHEFACRKCGRDCEILIRSSATRLACPHCGSKRLNKKFSLFAAQGTRNRRASSSCSSCSAGSCSTCRR